MDNKKERQAYESDSQLLALFQSKPSKIHEDLQ